MFAGSVFAIFVTTACHTPSKSTSKSLENECTSNVNGEKLFIGDEKCIAKLPRKTITGYWVVDHEYSVFYKRFPEKTINYDEEATWIDLSDSAFLIAKPLVERGRREIFEIRFVGTRSEAPGIYGPGTFKSGAFVDKFISIRKVS
jgi:hypothetical protein